MGACLHPETLQQQLLGCTRQCWEFFLPCSCLRGVRSHLMNTIFTDHDRLSGLEPDPTVSMIVSRVCRMMRSETGDTSHEATRRHQCRHPPTWRTHAQQTAPPPSHCRAGGNLPDANLPFLRFKWALSRPFWRAMDCSRARRVQESSTCEAMGTAHQGAHTPCCWLLTALRTSTGAHTRATRVPALIERLAALPVACDRTCTTAVNACKGGRPLGWLQLPLCPP